MDPSADVDCSEHAEPVGRPVADDPFPPPEPAPRADAPEEADGLPMRMGRAVWELCKTLAIVAVLVAGIRSFVVEAYVIHGASMEPTFHHDERLLVSKFAPRFESIARGDIIVFRHPTDQTKRLIKRVVALPGETVEIRGGDVYVDGTTVSEPYATHLGGSYFPSHTVARGCFFVLGDNREISNDSRVLGDVGEELVLGKAFLLFYPYLRAF
jgi:signal peptidase I